MFSVMNYLSAFVAIAVVYVASRIFRHMWTMRKIRNALAKYPQRKSHWFFGHLLEVPTSLSVESMDYFKSSCRQNPKAMPFLLGTWWLGYLRVWHPDTVKIILRSSEPKFIKYGPYEQGKDWLGEGLVLSSKEKWARNRKLLTPFFHFGALKKFVHIKNVCSQILLNNLMKLKTKGESVDMFDIFSLCTSDILLRCGFSKETKVQEDMIAQPYIQAVKTLSKLWVQRTFSPWLYYDWIYMLTRDGRKWNETIKFVHAYTANVIAEKKKEKRSEMKDFLDVLLAARDEDGNGLSDLEIQNEVDVMMFAGHDTTSSALAWTTYAFACNPEEQGKCQQEVDELLADRTSDDITHEDLNRLPYLTMCIKEAMRMHSIIPMIERELSQPLTIEGVELPRHTMIAIMLMCLNHNEEIWDEPDKYKPERFLPENIEKMDAYAFVPFSAGPRNCIGQNFAMNELKIVLARLLRRFTFKPDTEKLPQIHLSIVMKSLNGMHLYIEERSL